MHSLLVNRYSLHGNALKLHTPHCLPSGSSEVVSTQSHHLDRAEDSEPYFRLRSCFLKMTSGNEVFEFAKVRSTYIVYMLPVRIALIVLVVLIPYIPVFDLPSITRNTVPDTIIVAKALYSVTIVSYDHIAGSLI